MGAEITPIHGGRVPGEPSASVIEDLERLLASAKAGQLIGFAYAGTHHDGSQCTGWAGEAGTRHPIGTAIMMLSHRYAERLRDPS